MKLFIVFAAHNGNVVSFSMWGLSKSIYCFGICVRACLKYILRETGWDDMDWIYLAQNRDWWRGLVNTVMALRAP
jgi:hypothetical protein